MVKVFPSSSPAQEIRFNPDGVLLSNGPGDPKDVNQAVKTAQALLGELEMFGICMGHQVLARALGGKTFKLKFGHRGANHPIRNATTGEVFMTSQNHGYAVDDASLGDKVTVTHWNLNDNTVAGIALTRTGAVPSSFTQRVARGLTRP